MTSQEIMQALRSRYLPHQVGAIGPSERWAFFEELRIGTGYGKHSEQRIDAWVMSLWPSNGQARIAYEIKVSRADFLAELAKSLKRRAALLVSSQFYFVAPRDLIKPAEIPVECGLEEVYWANGDRCLITTVPAPVFDTPPPTWTFFAAIARRVFRAEAEQAVRP